MEEDEASAVNFIPCLCFVRTGVAKANPEKVRLCQINRILSLNFYGYSMTGNTHTRRAKKGYRRHKGEFRVS